MPRSRAASRPSFFRRISSKLPLHEKPKGGPPESVVGESTAPLGAKHERRPHRDAGDRVEEKSTGHHVQFSPDPSKSVGHSWGAQNNAQQEEGDESRPPTSNEAHPSQTPQGAHAPPLDTELHSTHDAGSNKSTSRTPSTRSSMRLPWSPRETDAERQAYLANRSAYSSHWREREAKSFVQQLRPWHGRLNKDRWLKVAVRPFVLFSYPAVLWSAAIYSCSIGWLIVVSESVTVVYRERYYHFDALQTGLMYISPFVGGVLGTAVAGRVSDVVVKAMARRNGGLYEPEFRLVMALPIAVATAAGLMGYGWSAEARDAWVVPTVFLGVVSFGCSLGSTTAITFCVDSYRQYAGESLVTLNFSKNIFHGLVFSFFVTSWLEEQGAKAVFVWIGVIQLIFCFFSIPMFIYGKRARMWTVRKNLMEKF